MKHSRQGAAWLCLAVAAVVLAAGAGPAGAQVRTPGPSNGPSYIFGLGDIVLDPANLARNVLHYTKRLEQIEMQKQQLTQQINALRKLPRPDWRNIGQLAQELDAAVGQANAIASSLGQADQLFRQTFPGYRAPVGGWTAAASRVQAERTLATLQGVVNAAVAHDREMRGAMSTLSSIKARMGTTSGTQQALELQTTMSGFEADQASMTRQVTVMQANADAVYHAYEVQRQAATEAAAQDASARLSGYRPATAGGFSGSRGQTAP